MLGRWESTARNNCPTLIKDRRPLPGFFVSVHSKGFEAALFTSLGNGAMPQPIEVKGQSEQQGLSRLHGQAAPRCFNRELAFEIGRASGRERGSSRVGAGV